MLFGLKTEEKTMRTSIQVESLSNRLAMAEDAARVYEQEAVYLRSRQAGYLTRLADGLQKRAAKHRREAIECARRLSELQGGPVNGTASN